MYCEIKDVTTRCAMKKGIRQRAAEADFFSGFVYFTKTGRKRTGYTMQKLHNETNKQQGNVLTPYRRSQLAPWVKKRLVSYKKVNKL
jgi:hypothetical protein